MRGEPGMTNDLTNPMIPDHARERLAEMRGAGGRRALFTSDLSVNEFLLTREAGFAPVGLVVGSSIYHIGFQMGRWNTNMELEKLTQAMYHARELAMARMEAEAEAVQAEGVVGTQIQEKSHGWGSHVVEYFAIGTAITSVSAEHQIPPPQLILPLS